jgi:hypothetical protein
VTTSGAKVTAQTNDPFRRVDPRIWDSDWLAMRTLAREDRRLAMAKAMRFAGRRIGLDLEAAQAVRPPSDLTAH